MPARIIADDRLREGYAYWCRKASGGRLPRRIDIDPTEIPHLLPHIRLVDVVGPGRFRYRLIGSEVREHHSSNPIGRYVDELLPPPAGPRVVALYQQCASGALPIYVEHEFTLPNASQIHRLSKVLYTPLSDDGMSVSHVLVFHVIAAALADASPSVDLWGRPYRELVHIVLPGPHRSAGGAAYSWAAE